MSLSLFTLSFSAPPSLSFFTLSFSSLSLSLSLFIFLSFCSSLSFSFHFSLSPLNDDDNDRSSSWLSLYTRPCLAMSARVRGPWSAPCWANMFASCKKKLSRYSCASLVPLGMKWTCISHSEQTWRHHLAACRRVMVTPAVCARLFEILTTLTFGALAKQETQRQGKLVVHVRSAMYHELSRTQPKLEGNVAWKNKISHPWRFKKLTISVIVHKFYTRKGSISNAVLIRSKIHPHKIAVVTLRFYIKSNRKNLHHASTVIIFGRMVSLTLSFGAASIMHVF